VAAYRAAVAQQPGRAGFDDPAVPAGPVAGLDAVAGDADGDASAADLDPQQAYHGVSIRSGSPGGTGAGAAPVFVALRSGAGRP
jgi:hypothetical protein